MTRRKTRGRSTPCTGGCGLDLLVGVDGGVSGKIAGGGVVVVLQAGGLAGWVGGWGDEQGSAGCCVVSLGYVLHRRNRNEASA